MTAGDDLLPPFRAIGVDRAGVRMRALRDVPAGPVRAFVRGTEVGEVVSEMTPCGAEIRLPIARLPRIEPPLELRFSTTRDGPEIAPPWQITSVMEAVELVGPGTILVDALRLEAGTLRGFLENPVNGWMEPLLYARINGAGARAVHTDAPQSLVRGGCGCRFAMPLLAADLREDGLNVTLHAVGFDAPLAHWAWTRAPAADTAMLKVRLEAQERALDGIAERLDAAQRRAHARQQERIDAFIKAAATLLFDRIALPQERGAKSDAASALRALIAAAGAPPAEPVVVLRLQRQAVLTPDAGEFGFGWHSAERDARGAFRWMSGRGLVLNPDPERTVAEVVLDVVHHYRAIELRATLDGNACTVAKQELTAGHTLRITPGTGPLMARTLLLEAPHAGVPALDGESSDQRQLSIAAARVVFEYVT